MITVLLNEHDIVMELMGYLRMLKKKFTVELIPETDVRMITFKMNDKDYARMSNVFVRKYKKKVVFMTNKGVA